MGYNFRFEASYMYIYLLMTLKDDAWITNADFANFNQFSLWDFDAENHIEKF